MYYCYVEYNCLANDVFALNFLAREMTINSHSLVFVPKPEVPFAHCGIKLHHTFIII